VEFVLASKKFLEEYFERVAEVSFSFSLNINSVQNFLNRFNMAIFFQIVNKKISNLIKKLRNYDKRRIEL